MRVVVAKARAGAATVVIDKAICHLSLSRLLPSPSPSLPPPSPSPSPSRSLRSPSRRLAGGAGEIETPNRELHAYPPPANQQGSRGMRSGMKKDYLDRRQALSDIVRVRVTVSDIVRVRVTVMYTEAARLVEV